MAIEQQEEMFVAILLRPLQLLRRLLRRGDLLPVDGHDHVSGLHAGIGRRAVWRHLGDDDTFYFALEPELLACRAVELTELQTKGARSLRTGWLLLAIVGRDLLLVVRHLTDIGLKLLVAATAQDGDVDLAIDRCFSDQSRQIVELVDLMPIELDDDIALLDAGTRRRAVCRDIGNERPALAGQAEAAGDFRRHLLDLNAKPAAVDLAVLAQLRDHSLGEVRGDGEADADAAAIRRVDRRVDADHLTLLGEGRATGVAAIDRGVELQEMVERTRMTSAAPPVD